MVAPEQLSRPPHPPRAPPSSEPPLIRPRARLSPQRSAGRQAPPADRLRASCSPNCSRPRSITSSSPSKPPSCKVGVSVLEPAAGAGLRSSRTHPPIPHPPALLMGRACQPPCPARCSSVRLRRTRSIGGEASSSASFPPRRSAPRKLLAELLPPAQAPASTPTASSNLQGRVGRAGDCGRPSGRPPFLRRAHPSPAPPALFHFPRPRAPQRAVAFRTFPPPSGPGAARPWLRRGRRKRRPGLPVIAHYPKPALRATPRLRAPPRHKRGLCTTRGGHLPGPPPDASPSFVEARCEAPPLKQGPADWLRRLRQTAESILIPPTHPPPPAHGPPPTPRRPASFKPPSRECFFTHHSTTLFDYPKPSKRNPGGLFLAKKTKPGFVFPVCAARGGEAATDQRG